MSRPSIENTNTLGDSMAGQIQDSVIWLSDTFISYPDLTKQALKNLSAKRIYTVYHILNELVKYIGTIIKEK